MAGPLAWTSIFLETFFMLLSALPAEWSTAAPFPFLLVDFMFERFLGG
jgi:hypothetical protein